MKYLFLSILIVSSLHSFSQFMLKTPAVYHFKEVKAYQDSTLVTIQSMIPNRGLGFNYEYRPQGNSQYSHLSIQGWKYQDDSSKTTLISVNPAWGFSVNLRENLNDSVTIVYSLIDTAKPRFKVEELVHIQSLAQLCNHPEIQRILQNEEKYLSHMYIKNKEGMPLKTYSFNQAGDTISKDFRLYNAQDELILMHQIRGTPESKSYYTIDTAGNVLSYVSVEKTQESQLQEDTTFERFYTYDDDLNLIKEESYLWGSLSQKSTYQYQIDGDTVHVSQQQLRFYGKGGISKREHTLSTYVNNLIVEKATSKPDDPNDKAKRTRYFYQFFDDK